MDDHTLLSAPLPDLLAAARAVRHGSRITYSPKVFIPLTMLCRDSCGYCTFAQPPARVASPYLEPEPRSLKRNEPALLARVVHRLCEIRGWTPEEADRITSANTRELFRLPIDA